MFAVGRGVKRSQFTNASATGGNGWIMHAPGCSGARRARTRRRPPSCPPSRSFRAPTRPSAPGSKARRRRRRRPWPRLLLAGAWTAAPAPWAWGTWVNVEVGMHGAGGERLISQQPHNDRQRRPSTDAPPPVPAAHDTQATTAALAIHSFIRPSRTYAGQGGHSAGCSGASKSRHLDIGGPLWGCMSVWVSQGVGCVGRRWARRTRPQQQAN